jgi:hypothetical protein
MSDIIKQAERILKNHVKGVLLQTTVASLFYYEDGNEEVETDGFDSFYCLPCAKELCEEYKNKFGKQIFIAEENTKSYEPIDYIATCPRCGVCFDYRLIVSSDTINGCESYFCSQFIKNDYTAFFVLKSLQSTSSDCFTTEQLQAWQQQLAQRVVADAKEG